MPRKPAPVPAPPAPVFVFRPEGPPEPARALGEHGRALWDRLHRDYSVTDAADIEQLLQLCQAVDLVETGDLDARSALAGRNFITKCLRNLFPDEERKRRPGRPTSRAY